MSFPSPTPPPSPPESREERSPSFPSVKVSTFSQQQTTESNLPYVPREEDSSPRAVDWRSRRSTRIAEDLRQTVGYPTTTLADGSVKRASGIWWMIEGQNARLSTMESLVKELVEERQAAKKSREDLAGFVRTRAERVFDKVLMMLIVALIGWFTRRSWMPADLPATPAGNSPAAPAAAK